jgi:hypothetical protein
MPLAAPDAARSLPRHTATELTHDCAEEHDNKPFLPLTFSVNKHITASTEVTG